MRFSKSFLEEIRQRLPVSQVVSRRVKLKRAGREFIGLSPFKVEKTPSFTVNDQKGFYHCFATGEHGDIFSFVMKTEGVSFYEAIEQLAAEAGVPLPAIEPAMQQREDAKERLYAAMEAAATYFQELLYSRSGSEALRYIEGRQVGEEAINTFRIGYAPNSKTQLKEYLTSRGFSVSDLITTGLMIGGQDIPVPYDRFRNRVMFPITDLKGRVIAFGGRALDPDQPAKYLNSPETPLFHKGWILFNAATARKVAYDTGKIIVAEGYMDVIALACAGFKNAVAPLGTALTEDQLQLLWRMADEPTLCFDGDAAGRKAAYRALETALPHIAPGKSVRFAYLPEGQDPDDLIRAHGAGAMGEVLDQAKPMFDVLWKKETDAIQTDTPEKRALLEQKLLELTGQIKHESVRKNYQKEMRQSLYQLERKTLRSLSQYGNGQRRNNTQVDWRTRQRAFNNPKTRAVSFSQRAVVSDELVANSLLMSDEANMSLRETLLVQTVLNHPWLLEHFSEEISELPVENKSLQEVRDKLLEAYYMQIPLDREQFYAHLIRLGLDRTLNLMDRTITHKSDSFVQPGASEAEVERGWKHLLSMQHKLLGLRRDLEDAERVYYQEDSEENYKRLCNIRLELLKTEEIEMAEPGLGAAVEVS